MVRHRNELIAEELRREIERRRWPPGARLPSTARLCARFGVSRMTIRRAIERLRSAGLVETRPSIGVFVSGTEVEVPGPRREEHSIGRLFTRLDALENRVVRDLAEIRARLDVIDARLDADAQAPHTDQGREAPCVR